MPPKSTHTKPRADKPAEQEEPGQEETAADEPTVPGLVTGIRQGGGTGNESPALPASAVTGAARAHALLDHALLALEAESPERVAAIIKRVQDELDRYLPASVKAAAVPEAAQVMAAGL